MAHHEEFWRHIPECYKGANYMLCPDFDLHKTLVVCAEPDGSLFERTEGKNTCQRTNRKKNTTSVFSHMHILDGKKFCFYCTKWVTNDCYHLREKN